MPEPSKQAVEAASLFFPAEWSEQEARAKAANALQAAYAIDYPALLEQARSEVEGEVRKRFNAEALKRGIRFAASIEELLDAALSPKEDT